MRAAVAHRLFSELVPRPSGAPLPSRAHDAPTKSAFFQPVKRINSHTLATLITTKSIQETDLIHGPLA
jgi:hypothetical protein